MNKRLKDILTITLGCFISSFGFHYFTDNINLVTGGVGGIGIILSHLWQVNTGTIVLFLNLILLFIGLAILGKLFFFKTVYGSLLYPLFIMLWELIDKLGIFTIPLDDKMMLTIFSSLTSYGIGLVMRAGGSTGGLDIPQVILNRKLNIPMNTSVYIIDGIVVLFGILTFGLEIGLYSILALFMNGFFIDRAMIGGPKKVVQIITDVGYERAIKDMIYKEIDRGVTEINALGGFTMNQKKLLICTMDAREYIRIQSKIYQIDPFAFTYITDTNQIVGRGWTRDKDFGVRKES